MQAVLVVQHLSAITVHGAECNRLRLQAAAGPTCLSRSLQLGCSGRAMTAARLVVACALAGKDMLTGAGLMVIVSMSAYLCGAPVRGPMAVGCTFMTLREF